MRWIQMDCRKMNFPYKTFDAVIDKGTLDIILYNKNYKIEIAQYLNEVERVLKSGGVFINVSALNSKDIIHHFKRDHLDFQMMSLAS